MLDIVYKKLILIILIYSIFLILVFLILKLMFNIQTEKRIEKFALDSKKESNSIIDNILYVCNKIVNSSVNIINKSSLLKDYGKHLEKYLVYEDEKKIGIRFVTYKFIIMIVLQILYIASLLLKLLNFNIFAFIITSIIGFMTLDIALIIIYNNRKKLFEEQLLQAVVIMNSAFKSGKNILGAIDIVRSELPNPIKSEFNIIYKDLTYGIDIEKCFERFYQRIKVEEIKYITSSLSLLSKTGGNIVSVFNMIEKNFYDRMKIKNELNSLTSTSKFLYRFLCIIPILFILVIIILNPTYFNPLITTSIGILITSVIVMLYFLYIIIIKKIMKVEEV